MDRLTTRNPDGTVGIGHPLRYYNHEDIVQVLDRLAAYEDTGLEPEELDDFARQACEIRMATGCRTLADCYRLAHEGRLVVLPCKVGDTIWINSRVFNGKELVLMTGYRKIDEIKVDAPNGIRLISNDPYYMGFHPTQFGKAVFLTREEAEQALKGE